MAYITTERVEAYVLRDDVLAILAELRAADGEDR